ncbi:band 7 family-domain-containing protein [Phakopsora pachyrhizi]|uniref:Band 7 family-domain-containing protein n=1 Tax=Phakopsora pachyrhizi TaxID=170000 RepID=A0AAV0BRQ2_PHAPC|nr:band 7 family-domain-containing protein [Phakopsora pachyrhizi]
MVNARNQHGSLSSLGKIFSLLGSLPGCCCLPSGKTTVPEGSAGLVFRSGKFHGSLHPGENQIDPLSDSLKIIELKTQTLLIKKLNAITRDLSKVEVDCTIYWRIDPYKATLSVKNHESALKLYAEACLQSGVGKRNLKEIINNREEISEEILNLIGKKSYNWGIEISSVLVAEIVTTNRLQQTLDHMVAEKLACSVKLTSARTDADAAAFIHASSDSATSSTAMEIRKLDVLKTLSNVPNAKIIIIPNLSAGADSSSSKNLSAQKPQNPSNNQPQQLLTNALPSSTSFPTSFNVSV